MSVKKKTVIIIAGPTAVGKTAVAIEVAQKLKTEIISADSRQCYKELNIGVARPSPEELQAVPHHFIASHSIQEDVNAGSFETFALTKTTELFEKHDTVVMTGGTGLYINAFCYGMDEVPEVPAAVRAAIVDNYREHGIKWLQSSIREKDPDFYQQGEIQNPQRLMRALEVVEATGQSILLYRAGKKKERDFNIIKIVLDLPRETLYERINNRVDQMIERGLLEEVKSLIPYKELNALHTVGYTELFEYLDDKLSLSEAIEQIKLHTRHYAKRQLTWFRKDKEWQWFQSTDLPSIFKSLVNY